MLIHIYDIIRNLYAVIATKHFHHLLSIAINQMLLWAKGAIIAIAIANNDDWVNSSSSSFDAIVAA